MDKIKVGLQYWIPQHGLTNVWSGKLASAKARRFNHSDHSLVYQAIQSEHG